LAVIASLVKRGAYADQTDNGHNTALIIAAIHGDIALAELLISKHADLESRNRNGSTALLLATANRRPEIVRLLLDAGVDLDKTDYGGTALQSAETRGFTEIAQMLRGEAGIRRSKETAIKAKTQHEMAVSKQIAFKNMEQLRKLKDKQGVSSAFNAPVPTLATEMDKALAIGDTKAIAALIKHGADKEQTHHRHNTPLMLAAIHGDTALAQLLIDWNADLKKLNRNGHTALMLAAMNDRVEITRLLLGAMADISTVSKSAWSIGTALQYAQRNNYVPIIRMLEEAAKETAGKPARDAVAEKQRALKNMALMQKLRKPAA
jgi:ankyrin repeat protein